MRPLLSGLGLGLLYLATLSSVFQVYSGGQCDIEYTHCFLLVANNVTIPFIIYNSIQSYMVASYILKVGRKSWSFQMTAEVTEYLNVTLTPF
jgi:hypothetical protein